MGPDASVMIVWSISTTEAQASGWDEIQPDHLLCALLKFAEVDVKNLDQFDNPGGEKQNLASVHRELREKLVDPWQIDVPKVSTSLRRGLRRKALTEFKHKAGIVHRSDVSRQVFSLAEKWAREDGKIQYNTVDLMSAIFAQQDEWIVRILKKHNLPWNEQDVHSHEDSLVRFEGIVHPVHLQETLSEKEHQRIQTDPIIKVLADWLTGESKQPCLLIYGKGRDISAVTLDLAHYAESMKLRRRFFSVNSRPLLESIAVDKALIAKALLQWINEASPGKAVYFFDSVHRYFSSTLAGDQFPSLFRAWIRKADNRVLCGIPESQYHKLIENKSAWTKVFQLVWIHESTENKTFEL